MVQRVDATSVTLGAERMLMMHSVVSKWDDLVYKGRADLNDR